MRYKVFLDTSTLIAGSICLTSATIGIDIKDAFYEEATRLISVIKKQVNKRIGITTYSVEDEAYFVLSTAIERKISQKVNDRTQVFELLSIAINACESRLKDILSFVSREPINPVDSARLLVQVRAMYDDLLKQAVLLPKPAAMQANAVPRFLHKSEMYEIYKTQDECLNAQLNNLIYNPVEESDKMHLSNAAYLRRLYKDSGEKITMYLSSTDHHFVPVRKLGYTSNQVTSEIESRFDIIAEKPHEIFVVLKKEYGE